MRLEHERGESRKVHKDACENCGAELGDERAASTDTSLCEACAAPNADAYPAASHLVNEGGVLKPE